jgi:DNA-binding protein YbaB
LILFLYNKDMFDKFKQLKQMKELRDSLSKEKEEFEKRGVRVVVNGKMEVEEIHLNSELTKEEQEEVVRECINEAFKKIQTNAAKKMLQTPGFGA